MRPRADAANPNQFAGYAVALPDDHNAAGDTIWYIGSTLAAGLSSTPRATCGDAEEMLLLSADGVVTRLGDGDASVEIIDDSDEGPLGGLAWRNWPHVRRLAKGTIGRSWFRLFSAPKSTYWPDDTSFVDAIVGLDGVTCVAVVDDELAEQRISFTKIALLADGVWHGGGGLKWDVIRVTRCAVPVTQYAIVGVHGRARFIGSGSIHEEDIRDGERSPASLGMLRGARSIAGVLYVCGMNRQVYRRTDRDRWSLLAAGFTTDSGVRGFEAIDGFGEDEIYAAGWEGEIWQFDGAAWRRRDSGTDAILVEVCCAGDGWVYALARGRGLIRGRGSQWEVLDLNPTIDLWSLAWFDGHLFACSTADIFVWDQDAFQPVRTAGDRPSTVQYLRVAEGGLCAVGAKEIFHFDGTSWMRID